MGIRGSEETQEMEAQAQIYDLTYRFAGTLILGFAVETGVADIIASDVGGRTTLTRLASKLALDPHRLHRLMRYLVRMEIISEEDGAGGSTGERVVYGLEPAGRCLLRDSETSMAPIVSGMTRKDFLAPWHHMKDGLAGAGGGRGEGTAGTAFERAMGMTIWEYLESHGEESRLFNEAMAGETRLLTASLVRGCEEVFGAVESLVDVGGGNGTTLNAISEAFPHIKCTVFDLPHVVANSHDYPHLERVPGDMFESVPSAQAFLLKLILHDWNDEDCIKILKRCKESVFPEGGRVIIVDVVLNEESTDELSEARMVLDIDMFVNTGGKERTEKDWKNLIFRAGYKGYKITHIEAIQSVIEALPY